MTARPYDASVALPPPHPPRITALSVYHPRSRYKTPAARRAEIRERAELVLAGWHITIVDRPA